MAAQAGTRKRKRAATNRGARSTVATLKNRVPAQLEWIEGPPTSGSHAPYCCCLWCGATTSRGHGSPMATDPAPALSRFALPDEYQPSTIPAWFPPSMQSSRSASPDPTPPTPWNSPASPPLLNYKPSILAECAAWAPSSRDASPDPTPPTPWNSPASPHYTPSIPSEYVPSTLWSFSASPDYTPLSSSEYTFSSSPYYIPSTPWTATSPVYTPATPQSHAALPDNTLSIPSSWAASPAYSTPSAQLKMPKISEAESRSSCSSRPEQGQALPAH